MKSKDQILLEEAYQNICEGKGAPCPCTVGKKCTKKDCTCKTCKKSKEKESKAD